ncbi:hypothetical protein FGRMN_452 [Fusarium graminum]|nr:hypothetical protein FGRMN_452 [Fusarium graminum]
MTQNPHSKHRQPLHIPAKSQKLHNFFTAIPRMTHPFLTELPYFRTATELPGPLPTLSEIHNSPSHLSPRRCGLSPPGGVSVIRNIYVVKYGKTVTEYEGNVLLFIEKHIQIAAPRLYAMYRDEPSGTFYLIMEYIPGVNLESMWPLLSTESKASITMQLEGIFDEIGSLKPPDDFIGGIDGGSLRTPAFQTDDPDPRINGPFKYSEQVGMALGLASQRFWEESDRSVWLPRFFTQHLGAALTAYEARLTHADLHMRNIMVEKVLRKSDSEIDKEQAEQGYEYRVRSIVDWESAGWYPAFWEYASALARPHEEADWPECVGHMIEPYHLELTMIFLVFQDLQLIY